MTRYKVNQEAFQHAKRLIRDGQVEIDLRDDWSEHAPSAAEQNAFIDDHGFDAFTTWFLAEDTSEDHDNKGRYAFPFGDFKKVHKCGVDSARVRAAQYHHPAVEKAIEELQALIDKK